MSFVLVVSVFAGLCLLLHYHETKSYGMYSRYCGIYKNSRDMFFDERYIPFYLIPILFVICQLTYLILSAIIIDINIAIHRNDKKWIYERSHHY